MCRETNPLGDAKAYHAIDRSLWLDWDSPRLAKITRLRLLSDPGYPVWDVSYCHGVTKDGVHCHVMLPFSELPKKRMLYHIVMYAKRDGINARKLGVFDALSTLV